MPPLKLKEGVEKVDEAATEEVTEEGAEVLDEGQTNVEAVADEEKAELKRKVADLEAKHEAMMRKLEERPTTTEAPVLTSEQLEGMNEAQRENIEKNSGFSFDQILSKVRANERNQERVARIRSEARLNVREAVDEAIESDPQAAKLKKHIREYMDGLPLEVQADKTQLSRQIARAKTYAKGAAGVSTPEKRKQSLNEPNPNDEPVFDKDKDDIKPGVYQADGMKIRIEAMDKKLADKIKHPERKNAVQIPSDFDEPPRFR